MTAEQSADYVTRIEPRHPVSCRCGGDTAYVLVQGGTEVMLGCTCHTLLDTIVGLVNERLALVARPKCCHCLHWEHDAAPCCHCGDPPRDVDGVGALVAHIDGSDG